MLTKSISLLLSSAFSVKYFSNKSKNKQVLSKIDNTQCDLYAWGNGIYGQLGLGAEKISQPIPDIVKSLNSVKIKQIYANYDTSCILTDDNTLYVWGKTKEGSIGLFPGGLSNNIVLPTVFPFSHQIQGKIAHVSLSKEHSAMVNDEGQIFTWGKDSFGCLGHANKENKKRGGLNISSILCDVVSSGEVKNVRCKQVACGYNYTIALSNEGEVYSWGYGKEGSLGNGSLDIQSAPRKIKGLSNIRKISCGSFFGFALSNEGKLYSWGKNNYGQVGSGTQKQELKVTDPLEINLPYKVKDIFAGEEHSALITEEGEVYTWGYGLDGRLGNGVKQNMISPKKANLPEKIVKVSCGGNHTAFLGVSGNLYMCGNGRNGELGRGELLESQSVQRTEPLLVVHFQFSNQKVLDVATGSTHTIALVENINKI